MGKENLVFNEWLPYTGDYEKQECDVKLKDGTILKHIWPNAGKFIEMCGKRRTALSSEVAEIMYIKYYQDDLCPNCKTEG